MIRRLANSPVSRIFSTAVLDQAVLSLANFAVVMILVRYSEFSAYGYFVLVQVTISLVVSAQSAWLCGPLLVLGPKKAPEARDAMIAEVRRGRRRFFIYAIPLALPLPLIGAYLAWWSDQIAALALAGVFAGGAALSREFARSALLMQGRPGAMLAADVLYVSILLGGIGVAVNLPGSTALWAVIDLAFAALAGGFLAYRLLALPKAKIANPKIWQEMRPLGVWSTCGAVVYWTQSQAFNYVLAARLAVEAVANVNAARLLLMPAFLLSTGIAGLLVPSASGWLVQEGLRKLLRRMFIFAAILMAMDVFYIGSLWIGRDLITDTLLKKEITDRDVLILLWGSLALLSLLRDVLQAPALALEKFKPLAFMAAIAAVCSLTIMWFSIDRFGAPGAVVGTIAGEIIYVSGLMGLLIFNLRLSDRQAREITKPSKDESA